MAKHLNIIFLYLISKGCFVDLLGRTWFQIKPFMSVICPPNKDSLLESKYSKFTDIFTLYFPNKNPTNPTVAPAIKKSDRCLIKLGKA